MAGYVPFDPNKPLQPPAPADTAPAAAPAPTKPGAYVPFNPNAATTTSGGQTTADGAAQPSQPGDWSSVAWNEAAMGTIPGLRAQAEAARKRLDPVTAASADVAGNFASPTTALNFVPYVGPELAGGLHEGIKSAVSNWTPDQSWPTYLSNVGKDTAGGVAGGLVGHGAGAALTNPELLKLGGGGLTGLLLHPHLSGDYREVLGALGAYKGLGKIADKTSELIATPTAQAAIRSLVQGGTAAARASSPGPLWDQWVPGQ
jgi:hypothetical protein